MSAFRSRRSLRTALDSFWLIPALYVLLALGLAVVLMRWDETDPVELARSIPPEQRPTAMVADRQGLGMSRRARS